MRIAILAESDYDTPILQELTQKVAATIQPPIDVEFLAAYETGGTVIPKMEVASVLFFEGATPADCAVFGIDLDRIPSRRKTVSKFASTKAQEGISVAPLFADPHIEEILFADGGHAIKRVLIGLSPETALPYAELEPKSRLLKLIRDFGPRELSITTKDVYRSIASEMDVDQLARNSANFRRFKDRLTRILQPQP